VLGVASSARAQSAEVPRARALADEGANSFARGDYARAEALLDNAYALVPAPTVGLLRARSLMRLNQWVDALRVYTSVSRTPLDLGAPEPFRRAVRDAERERVALEPRVPRLKLDLAPVLLASPSLIVRIDGGVVPRARLGGFIAVDPGVHALRVEANGRPITAFHLTLEERERLVVPVQEARAERSGSAKTWGIASLAAGGAALGFGVVAGVIALDAHSDASRECPDRTCPPGGRGEAALDRFETYRTLSTIGYIAGAAGIGAGTIVLLTSSSAEPRVVATASLNGVRVRGSW
jgi:hypothetical protein